MTMERRLKQLEQDRAELFDRVNKVQSDHDKCSSTVAVRLRGIENTQEELKTDVKTATTLLGCVHTKVEVIEHNTNGGAPVPGYAKLMVAMIGTTVGLVALLAAILFFTLGSPKTSDVVSTAPGNQNVNVNMLEVD